MSFPPVRAGSGHGFLPPDRGHCDAERAADVLGRLVISYVLDPLDDESDEFAEWFVRLLFDGVVPEPRFEPERVR